MILITFFFWNSVIFISSFVMVEIKKCTMYGKFLTNLIKVKIEKVRLNFDIFQQQKLNK
eukprot:UN13436